MSYSATFAGPQPSINWSEQNPVLDQFQIGTESDTGLTKTGDGVTAWNDLKYDGQPRVRLITGATVVDEITSQDLGRILYYSTDDPCDVSIDAGALFLGFNCRIIRNQSADKVVLDSGSCQSASGFFCVKAGGTVNVACPDAATMFISGDLCQESTLFADLPASPTVGDIAIVSDSSVLAWGDPVAGGGSDTVLVFYSAAEEWVVLARP